MAVHTYLWSINLNNEILPSATRLNLEGIVLSKTNRERQMPHDFTYMWNLKNKINKQNGNILLDTENILMLPDLRWLGEWVQNEGIKKYKLVALTCVDQWVGQCPQDRKVASSVPGQGKCLGVGPCPWLGVFERQPIDVSLPLFLLPMPSL